MGCTSSFASAVTALVPIGSLETCDVFEDSSFDNPCRYKYIFYVGVFSMIVSSMTLLYHFNESKLYLIGVCIGRMIIIVIMSFTAVNAYLTQKELNSSEDLNLNLHMVRLSGFGISAQIILLTMGFHVLIPEMLQPLKNKKKNSIKMIFYTMKNMANVLKILIVLEFFSNNGHQSSIIKGSSFLHFILYLIE